MAERLLTPCNSGTHGRTSGIQNDYHDPDCVKCTKTVVHNHFHTEPPYKAGCPLCSTKVLVKCSCGEYH